MALPGMKDWSRKRQQHHRQALAWTLLAGTSFLIGNAWLVTRYLGPVG